MPRLLSRLALLTLALWCPAIMAQDLISVYRLALEQDAELQVAESDYLAAIEALPIAKAGRLPQIFFNASGSRRESDNSETGDNTNDTIGYSLSLTQSLYDTDVSNSIGAAEATAAAQLATLEAARQNLILRVAQTYFSVLAAQDNVEFAYAERNAIERQLEQAKKRFEVGLIAITDVQEAQARYDSAEAQAIQAENILENAYQSLAVITGDAGLRELDRVGERLQLQIPDPAGAEAWVKLALVNNRDLIAAQQALAAARYERNRNARGGYPTVDLVASYADNDIDDDQLGNYDQEDLTVAIELEMPLYTGGRISAQKAQANAALRSAQNTLLLQNRLASQGARTAYLDVVSGISQVNALKQALESSNIALEATRAGFEVGTRTSVDVLVSLRETFRAQRDYAGSRYDYLVNTLRLRQAAGTLGEDDLRGVNRWLVQR